MSSVQMIFGYGDCEEKRKNYYFTVTLYAKHNPEDLKSPVVVIAQHPLTTELFCGTVSLDAKMLTYAQEILEQLDKERSGPVKLKSKLPPAAGLQIFRASLEKIREKYSIR
jgi:hypothetical protein